MTHAELVERAGRWLRGAGCSVVFEELTTSSVSEIPDAIGWRDGGRLSYLVECKAGRGDFLADRKKPFRESGKGMGCYRYFMCPPGLIRASELPDRWGLLYAHAKKVTVEAGRHPTNWDARAMARCYHRPDREGEVALLTSALLRLRLDLGDALWRERVHRSYADRQRMAAVVGARRHLFPDDEQGERDGQTRAPALLRRRLG